MKDPIITAEGLCHTYSGCDLKSLDDITLSIERGSRTVILGANGAGKSTFFLHLNGVLKPKSGRVLYNGKPIDYSRKALMALRTDISIVFQNPDDQIFSSTVEEDIAFGPMNLGLSKEETERRVNDALSQIDMMELRNSPTSRLSFGQRRRVVLAGALAMRPKVMILDEPTSGIDSRMSYEVLEIMEQLIQTGTTVIMSTHDVDLACAWADEIHVMNKGKLVYSGDPGSFFYDKCRTESAGLTVPSICNLKRRLMPGSEKSPRTASQLLGLISDKRNTGTLTIVCIGRGDTMEIDKDTVTGIYGTDTRRSASASGISADYDYDALEQCLSACVCGNDCTLYCDEALVEKAKADADALGSIGNGIRVIVRKGR